MASITANELERFEPMNELCEEQRRQLAGVASVEKVARGTVLMERGAMDSWTVYLFDGSLALEAADKAVVVIDAGAPRSFSPIARLLPRQYRVVATAPSTIVRIANQHLEQMVTAHMQDAYNVTEELQPSSEDFRYALNIQLQRDLQDDRLILPTLPEVAAKIRQQLKREDSSIEHIAQLIQSDPIIAAKVIKAANSALYGGQNIRTCKAAIDRLGTKVTAQLVTSLTAQELFHSESPVMRQWMRNLWEHSTNVAAMSFVLASNMPPMFEPERAMLAGLLHDVGTVAILNYTNQFSSQIDSTDELDVTITELRGKIGALILQRWNFDEDIVKSALHCEDWERDESPAAELSDVVMMAQLHSFLLSPLRNRALPSITKLPAFKKLRLDTLDAAVGIRIINEAKEQVAEVKRLLSL